MFKLSAFVTLMVILASSLQVILAAPSFTSPIASTSSQGGQKLSVKWQDNGQSPAYNAKSWGNSTLYLATGDTNTQYKLQTLHANMPPSRTQGSFTIDPSVGPSGQYYFMRMEGTDTVNGIPVMAFSARFTLTGMSGQFNSTVMAAATGKEGPSTGSSSASSGSSSSASSMSTSVASTGTSAGSAFPTQVASTNSTSKPSSAGRLTSNNFFTTTMTGTVALAVLGLMAFI